jgi:hypothetical protein
MGVKKSEMRKRMERLAGFGPMAVGLLGVIYISLVALPAGLWGEEVSWDRYIPLAFVVVATFMLCFGLWWTLREAKE